MFERILKTLPEIADNPLSVMAYLLFVGAWVFWLFKRVQMSTYLKTLDKLPDGDRIAYAKEIDLPLAELASLSEGGRVAVLTKRYRLFAYLATLAAILIFGALIATHLRKEFVLKTKIDEIEKQRAAVQKKLDLQTRQLLRLATGVAKTAGRLTIVASVPEVVREADALNDLVTDLQEDFAETKLSAEQNETVRLAIATVANARHDYEKTLILLDETFSNDAVSRAGYVLRLRGDAFYGLQNWEQALVHYERNQSLQAQDPYITLLIGNCELLLGHCERAIDAFSHVLDKSSSKLPAAVRVSALNNRGDAYAIMGNLDRALADFTTAIGESSLDPELSSSKVEVAMSLANRAFVYNGLHKDAEATADHEEVRRIIGELDSHQSSSANLDEVITWLRKRAESMGPPVVGHGQKSACFMCHPGN